MTDLLMHPAVDDVTRLLIQSNTPVTRENWLRVAYFGQLPDPRTLEREEELSQALRDFSRCRAYRKTADPLRRLAEHRAVTKLTAVAKA